jgi:hypothetical protein
MKVDLSQQSIRLEDDTASYAHKNDRMYSHQKKTVILLGFTLFLYCVSA